MSEDEAIEPEVVDEDQFLQEAKDRLPVSQEEAKSHTHPLAKGLRAAKAKINEILKDSENLEKLEMALQTEFDKDPLGFLQEFLPLLEKYDEIKEDRDSKQSVRIYQKEDETAIEFTAED